MRWDLWKPFYKDIVEKLGLNPEEDRMATALLSTLLKDVDSESLIRRLKQTVKGRTVVVCGAGPSLEKHLDTIISSKEKDIVFAAADGAVSAFVSKGMVCDILVTDLDGDISDLKEMARKGAITIVHAHGDNIDVVEKYVPKLGMVLGSTQVEPLPNVYLWGGFTDGDRACHIVSQYMPSRVILAGMDFGDKVGHWSKPGHTEDFPASERKRIKLDIARQLIYELKSRSELEFTLME